MNRAQQKEYLEDYAEAKRQGKPFFPYAIYKDHVVAFLAIALVIFMSVAYRVEVGEPVNPATTDFVPRPEWYFFFLFELLKVFKNQNVFTPVIMGSFLVPNIMMILLIAWPFIDRGPERRIEKRPISLAIAVVVIALIAWLTEEGANSPSGQVTLELEGLNETTEAGLALYEQNGCSSCHMIKGQGAPGPGPDLTNEASRNRGLEWHIDHLREPSSRVPGSSMPAFTTFTDEEYNQLGQFLEGLGDTIK